MRQIPSEVDIFGVYWPPLLVAVILAIIATLVTIRLLNKTRLSRFLMLPEYVVFSMLAIYTVVIGTFIVPA